MDLLRVVFGPHLLQTSVLAIGGLRLDGESTALLIREALHIEGEDDRRTLIDALLSTASQLVVGLALTGAEAKCGGEEQCSERISKDFLHSLINGGKEIVVAFFEDAIYTGTT